MSNVKCENCGHWPVYLHADRCPTCRATRAVFVKSHVEREAKEKAEEHAALQRQYARERKNYNNSKTLEGILVFLGYAIAASFAVGFFFTPAFIVTAICGAVGLYLSIKGREIFDIDEGYQLPFEGG